jgi:hypothetical protein
MIRIHQSRKLGIHPSAGGEGTSVNDRSKPIIRINPKARLPVTTAPIFTPPNTCWKKR